MHFPSPSLLEIRKLPTRDQQLASAMPIKASQAGTAAEKQASIAINANAAAEDDPNKGFCEKYAGIHQNFFADQVFKKTFGMEARSDEFATRIDGSNVKLAPLQDPFSFFHFFIVHDFWMCFVCVLRTKKCSQRCPDREP